MTRIRKIGIMSVGKVFGFIFAFLGFVLGLTVSLLSIMGMTVGGPAAYAVMSAAGFAAVIILPIFYGIVGFTGGLIFAGLYNLAAGWIGGIEVDLH